MASAVEAAVPPPQPAGADGPRPWLLSGRPASSGGQLRPGYEPAGPGYEPAGPPPRPGRIGCRPDQDSATPEPGPPTGTASGRLLCGSPSHNCSQARLGGSLCAVMVTEPASRRAYSGRESRAKPESAMPGARSKACPSGRLDSARGRGRAWTES